MHRIYRHISSLLLREYSSLWVILVCIFPLTDTNWLQAFPVRNSYTKISPSILFFYSLFTKWDISIQEFFKVNLYILKYNKRGGIDNSAYKWPSIINLQLLHNNTPFSFLSLLFLHMCSSYANNMQILHNNMLI